MEVITQKIKWNRQYVFPFLKDEVFHVTTQKAYQSILKKGAVLNNKDGQFKINTSSEKSFGRLSGYVCFFDLRNKNNDDIDHIIERYNFIAPRWLRELNCKYDTWNLAYMILNHQYYSQLILYNKLIDFYNYSGEYPQAIPNTECWINDFVPIDWFEKTYLIQIISNPTIRE